VLGRPAPAVRPAAAPAPPVTVPVSQPSPPTGGPITRPSYTVRPGDSLWSIARRLLGPEASAGRVAREVNRLWELNRQRIGTGNPSLIRVGTVLEL
jgi:nucleoid-associated protein YgaU